MSDNRYHVIYTGKLASGMDAATVKSNLILDVGLSENKADLLLSKSRVLIKRLSTSVEAELLTEKLERAGILCCIEQRTQSSKPESPTGGESSLITFFNKLKPTTRRASVRPVTRKG